MTEKKNSQIFKTKTKCLTSISTEILSIWKGSMYSVTRKNKSINIRRDRTVSEKKYFENQKTPQKNTIRACRKHGRSKKCFQGEANKFNLT